MFQPLILNVKILWSFKAGMHFSSLHPPIAVHGYVLIKHQLNWVKNKLQLPVFYKKEKNSSAWTNNHKQLRPLMLFSLLYRNSSRKPQLYPFRQCRRILWIAGKRKRAQLTLHRCLWQFLLTTLRCFTTFLQCFSRTNDQRNIVIIIVIP